MLHMKILIVFKCLNHKPFQLLCSSVFARAITVCIICILSMTSLIRGLPNISIICYCPDIKQTEVNNLMSSMPILDIYEIITFFVSQARSYFRFYETYQNCS